MGERSKGKLSHASSYGSSGQDRFHSGAAHEAYWKNHRGNNQSIPNWQRDRRQAGGTDNPTVYLNDNCRKHKNHINSNSSHPNYSSTQNSDPLYYKLLQNYKSYRNKNENARKDKDFKEDVENDADNDDDDDDEVGGDDYYENETNAKEEEEENQVESCVSSETIEKDNEDPGEEAEENYAPQNIRHKFEKFPSSMMEKLKMMDFAHAMKMNHQRRLQKKYHNMIATQRNCQDIQDQEVTDEVTEDDDEIQQRRFRRPLKQPINYRQPNSWSSSRDHDTYNLIRSHQQMYNYPKKYDFKQATLDPHLEFYSQNRPCRYCGGTGSDVIEPAITRKINCRVHDSPKVNFSNKEKFDGESGDQGERYTSGRRISPKMNFHNATNLASQKCRRSRNTRSPART